jgi:hypothetical protein
MPRKVDVKKLKASSRNAITEAMKRIDDAEKAKMHYLLVRWMSAMTAVELHSIWERYSEARIVAALNHDAKHFIAEEDIVGVSHVSFGLASFIVRGGNKYFGFKSMSDLLGKATRWLGKPNNPFQAISTNDRNYIDVLAAVRNCVVHKSDAAWASYRSRLHTVYGISYPPEPEEFLNAKDNRQGSPLRYESRLKGIATVLDRAIGQT